MPDVTHQLARALILAHGEEAVAYAQQRRRTSCRPLARSMGSQGTMNDSFAPMYERAFAREALRSGRCVFEEVLSGVR
jgi:hypothetical protein